MHIGAKITDLLKLKNRSVPELSEYIGISKQSTYKMLKKQHINTEMLQKICEFFKVDFLVFFQNESASGNDLKVILDFLVKYELLFDDIKEGQQSLNCFFDETLTQVIEESEGLKKIFSETIVAKEAIKILTSTKKEDIKGRYDKLIRWKELTISDVLTLFDIINGLENIKKENFKTLISDSKNKFHERVSSHPAISILIREEVISRDLLNMFISEYLFLFAELPRFTSKSKK